MKSFYTPRAMLHWRSEQVNRNSSHAGVGGTHVVDYAAYPSADNTPKPHTHVSQTFAKPVATHATPSRISIGSVGAM